MNRIMRGFRVPSLLKGARYEQWRHVERKIDDSVFDFQVLDMQDGRRLRLILELLPKLSKRNRFIVAAAFDFDRNYVVLPCRRRLAQKKVHFHAVLRAFAIGVGEEEKSVSGRSEHLGDDVFHQHALVKGETVVKNALMDFPGPHCRRFERHA